MKTFSMNSFVLGFIFGAVIIGAWSISGDLSIGPVVNSNSNNAKSTQKKTSKESGAVSVVNQSAGPIVKVESVTVTPPGVWVAVREVNGDTLGNVLGAEYVRGPRSNITVTLLRTTSPNRPYVIELYRDNGDGVFNLSNDSVYIDFTTGASVVEHFKTTK